MVALRTIFMLTITTQIVSLRIDESDTDELCYVCSCSDGGSVVDCSKRGLTDVPGETNLKVQNLNISYNEISTFPENLKRFPNLIKLDLSSNQISVIPKNSLQDLTILDWLNLSNNNFESWTSLNPNDILAPTVGLKWLDLSNNKFTTLGNLESHELLISSSLETLVLENCLVTSIHGKSPLSGLTNIKILKLSRNPLKRIQNLASTSLRSLYASNCQLSFMHHNDLLLLPSLIYLQLSHNYRLVIATTSQTLLSDSLRYIDISYSNVMKPSLGGFPNLKKALINHNMIRYLTNEEFVNNTKLEHMDLSYNSITSLQSGTFKGLVNLKHLDLSWNEISKIPEKALLEMPKLSIINLSRNYLTEVGHLKSLSVTVIDMNQCEISSIGKDSFEGLESLVEIKLSRNLLSSIPDSISSNTLQHLNLNYNRIRSINNYTFYMLPKLLSLSLVGNRFTSILRKSYFKSNPYLEKLDLDDNMWRCDCSDDNMFDFYEYVTLEPNKKEESFNLICNSPNELYGLTWFEACYLNWFPYKKAPDVNSVIWFLITMIIGLSLIFCIVSLIKRRTKRRLEALQAERQLQVEETRDRLRQMRMRAEQEAQLNAPDPRDSVPPPSYTEALSMPKLNTSSFSLNETGTGKAKRRRGRRKTKSSGDLLEETERNGDFPVAEQLEMTEIGENRRQRRRRRARKYGSHEIAELDDSPGARRRRMSSYEVDNSESTTFEVEAELARPLRSRPRANSIDDD